MTTSLQDLLDAARRAPGPPSSRQRAEAAISALGQVSRALRQVGGNTQMPPLYTLLLNDPRTHQLVSDLSRHAHHTASSWPATTGRLPDLVGAAADVAGRLAPQLTPDARWAIAVAFAETARHCAYLARSHAPYRNLPPLIAVHTAAAAVEQHAAARPPTVRASAVLDRPVPRPKSHTELEEDQQVDEAAAALLASVSDAVTHHRLTVAEALATASAARAAAHHAATLTATLDRANARAQAWRSAPHAWHTVATSYAPFDDGTKYATPIGNSAVLQAAVLLYEEMRSEMRALIGSPLGPGGVGHPVPASPPDQLNLVTPHHDRRDRVAALLRAATNPLPDLARLLSQAAACWQYRKQLYAPERRLLSYENRNAAVTTTDRVVHPEPSDLQDLLTSLQAAEQLSTALAVELDRTANSIGRRPQPHLAAAHTAALAELPAAALTRAATTARRLAATPLPIQWTAHAATRQDAPRRPGGPRR